MVNQNAHNSKRLGPIKRASRHYSTKQRPNGMRCNETDKLNKFYTIHKQAIFFIL